ncbi:Transposon Ty3-I Gag-Pol polyprotein [Grifola frondosa]|uniref:Transposon Ty3-I Gag-Pol polyprotein n=1 Tax=Grifola frondosa TaxID=5627 RepID=A0A1C7M6L1_GRIFR|nr:Transposon Ty3-I Gag-Pol polyprotein [Grifola frondosa]
MAEVIIPEQRFLAQLSESTEGIDLLEVLSNRYGEDKFFRNILEGPKQYKNFLVENGLVFVREHQQKLLCIPQIIVNGRNVREIVISHAHSLLAHLGTYKTLGLLRDHVWWKSMTKDVQTYCDSCKTCRRSKPPNQKPYGLLNPLPVPGSPWEAIGIDFVGPLPESKDRDSSYDSITTVIDLLTGMVHLIPSRTNYTAKQVAELVFSEVYKHHGMPRAIVSDRDVLFTSLFWAHLHKLIGVELRMSSAYHPESDGSTERANRTLTQMLRQCVGSTQKDWVAKLPTIEFAINIARSDSTGYAPFFLNTGRMPRAMIWNDAHKDEYPGVRAYAQRMKNAIMAAHDSILAARVKQMRNANRRRQPAPFVDGDLVYISTKNISLPKGLARKLAPKFIGPYKIIRDFKNNSYRIDLPANLKRRGIHDVFHSSLLRIHVPNDDRLFPGRLDNQVAEFENKDDEWAIDKIITHRGSREHAVFEAVWKSGDHTWVNYRTIEHLDALKSYFEALGIESVAQLPDGVGQPPDDPQIFLGGLEVSNVKAGCVRGIKAHPRHRYKQRKLHSRPILPHPNPTLFPSNSTPPLAYSADLPITSLLGIHPEPLLLTIMAENINLSRTDKLDVVLTRPGLRHRHVFNLDQVHLFCNFDQLLRTRRFNRGTDIVPGGYESFAALWNEDIFCPYRFCTFDTVSGASVVLGEPVPTSYLIPERPPTPPSYTLDQQRAIESLLWQNALRSGRQQDFYSRRRAEREEANARAKRPRLWGEVNCDVNRNEKGRGRGKKPSNVERTEESSKKGPEPPEDGAAGGSSSSGTAMEILEA